MRRIALLTGKLTVSALLLYLALRAVGLDALWQRLSDIDPIYAAGAVAALVIQVLIAARRWHIILKSMALPLSTASALRITFIGAFFNQTLPSTVGGDAMRIWLAGRRTGAWRDTVYSVLLDRLMGLIGLLSLGLLAILFLSTPKGGGEAVRIVTWVITGSFVAVIGFLFFDLTIERFFANWRAVRALNDLCTGARRLILRPSGMAVWAMSALIQALTVIAAWLLAQSIAAPAPLGAMFFVIPIVVLISMAPVSVAGWGLREGAMVTAFTLAGLNGGDAFAISVLLGLALLIVGAIGGIAWIAGGYARSTAQHSVQVGKGTVG